jgi:hypothetical protein
MEKDEWFRVQRLNAIASHVQQRRHSAVTLLKVPAHGYNANLL